MAGRTPLAIRWQTFVGLYRPYRGLSHGRFGVLECAWDAFTSERSAELMMRDYAREDAKHG